MSNASPVWSDSNDQLYCCSSELPDFLIVCALNWCEHTSQTNIERLVGFTVRIHKQARKNVNPRLTLSSVHKKHYDQVNSSAVNVDVKWLNVAFYGRNVYSPIIGWSDRRWRYMWCSKLRILCKSLWIPNLSKGTWYCDSVAKYCAMCDNKQSRHFQCLNGIHRSLIKRSVIVLSWNHQMHEMSKTRAPNRRKPLNTNSKKQRR